MASAPKYNPHYSIKDYQEWSGDWELWFGTAVAMSPSPFGPHERIVIEFVDQIKQSIKQYRCDCRVYAGLDWIVQDDTVVRPDAMIVCGDQPERHLEKVPSLIVEVLSEATASKDLKEKRTLYQSQGVEFYLIADPNEHTILTLELNDEVYVQDLYSPAQDEPLRFCLPDGCVITIDRIAIFA